MKKNGKIYVAGHRGLVGSALVRKLKRAGYTNLLLKTRAELDLTDQRKVARFFEKEKPAYVFVAAAKVGGILANRDAKADILYENLAIQTNIIHSAWKNQATKLLFLGSSCIYPKMAPQPLKEEYLLTGPLEETNDAYAVAKIAGIKMCQSYNEQYGTNFISAMPTNLYGPNDNFDLVTSHVLPALMRKFHEAHAKQAKEVILWGTGSPRREFLHVDDLADALLFLMRHYNQSEIVNVGTGKDLTIRELAEKIKKLVGYEGKISWDRSKPDGTPRKLLDVSRLHKLGWKHRIGLDEGLKKTYHWLLEHHGLLKK